MMENNYKMIARLFNYRNKQILTDFFTKYFNEVKGKLKMIKYKKYIINNYKIFVDNAPNL